MKAPKNILSLMACLAVCALQGCDSQNSFPQTAKEWNERACYKFDREEYSQACDDWDMAVKKDDRNPVLYWRRSRACRQIGRLDQAVDDATKSLDLLTPDDKRRRMFYLDNRAKAYMKRGNYDEAKKDFDEAIKLANGESDAAPFYLARGQMNMELAEPDLALKDYSKAIELVPTWGKAYHLRAQAYEAKADAANAGKDNAIAMHMNYEEADDKKYEPLPIRSEI
jgi:tetratricopeptide (TPR) repeat protein